MSSSTDIKYILAIGPNIVTVLRKSREIQSKLNGTVMQII